MLKKLLIAAALFIFVGCTAQETEVPPVGEVQNLYFYIEDHIKDGYWQNFISIETDADDLIVSLEMDGVPINASTTRYYLSTSESYYGVFGYNFYEEVDEFKTNIIGTPVQELPEKIRSHEDFSFDRDVFANLAEQAIAAGPHERGTYLDGFYQEVAPANEEGLYFFVNLMVKHGSIIAVHWNAIDEDGQIKYNPTAFNTTDATQWRSHAALLEQKLIAVQDPSQFVFDSSGHAIDFPTSELEAESFIRLVTLALAKGPLATETQQ